MKKRIHLVCNAHIDPVWLWEWEEGAAEALATFRAAAELCEAFDGFVFNHNEALLYEWVEAFEPALFRKIRRLVRAGKWHIMGGWYLQPDCNMPSGESFVRQILTGKGYFRGKFGVRPSAAVNLDPFGHTRGLAQILAKSGYDAYLFCRPSRADCGLPAPEFTWVGYDGSEVTGCLATAHYNTYLGKARKKVEAWMAASTNAPCSLLLWGVGNHGGGPSRGDLRDLRRLMNRLKKEGSEFEIVHSTPEAFFKERRRRGGVLPRHKGDLNPWAVGCYTSMMRVKEKHRELEGALYLAEKMAAAAAFQDLMPYPRAEIRKALKDLLFAEFHDALPGSSVPGAETGTLQRLDHGLEIMNRIRAKAFFRLTAGQKKAGKDAIPVLVYNPHPHRVETLIECEMQRAEPNWTPTFLFPEAHAGGKALPCQVEKEACNIKEDHRKKIVFKAVLEPSSMNRFDCRLRFLTKKPAVTLKARRGAFRFRTNDLEVVINGKTGLVDRYRVRGVDYVKPGAGAFRVLVMKDNGDPWGMTVNAFRRKAGQFRLVSRSAAARIAGAAEAAAPPVRVIEDGAVRTVVEALFAWGDSVICQQYKLPRAGVEVEVALRVLWNEKDKMLKLSVPTAMADAEYLGEVAFGTARLKNNGNEMVAQRWTAAVCRKSNRALTLVNDKVYGSDMHKGEVRLSLLRAPAHAAHPVAGRLVLEKDRFIPRVDQGEHLFRFWLKAGAPRERLANVSGEAVPKQEQPFALACFPPGGGRKPRPAVVLSDRVVQLVALKKAEKGGDLVIRLFNPTAGKRACTLSLPFGPARKMLELGAYEVRTYRFSPRSRKITETNLLEEPLK